MQFSSKVQQCHLSPMRKFHPYALKASQVVRNVGEGNYDAALISDFDSLEDLARYKADPRHQAVSALCKSIRESRAAVDYEL